MQKYKKIQNKPHYTHNFFHFSLHYPFNPSDPLSNCVHLSRNYSMDNENVVGVVGVVGRLYNIYIHVYIL